MNRTGELPGMAHWWHRNGLGRCQPVAKRLKIMFFLLVIAAGQKWPAIGPMEWIGGDPNQR